MSLGALLARRVLSELPADRWGRPAALAAVLAALFREIQAVADALGEVSESGQKLTDSGHLIAEGG